MGLVVGISYNIVSESISPSSSHDILNAIICAFVPFIRPGSKSDLLLTFFILPEGLYGR